MDFEVLKALAQWFKIILPSGTIATVGATEQIFLHSSSITCGINPLKYQDLKMSTYSFNENV
jgi:hypothetical protein